MPILKEPVSSTSTTQEAKIGNKTLIEGIGFYDKPEPGTGNLLGWTGFPGDGKVAWYPGCVPLEFAIGSIVMWRADTGEPQAKARPNAACITVEDGVIHYHPPADQPDLRALARLCEQFGISFDAPDAPVRLALELARSHRAEIFTQAGRELRPDERRMSIAWLIDQEQQKGETVPSTLVRVWDKLVRYGLIETGTSPATAHRLAKQGARLLTHRGMVRWRGRGPGRPKKGTHQPG